MNIIYHTILETRKKTTTVNQRENSKSERKLSASILLRLKEFKHVL